MSNEGYSTKPFLLVNFFYVADVVNLMNIQSRLNSSFVKFQNNILFNDNKTQNKKNFALRNKRKLTNNSIFNF